MPATQNPYTEQTRQSREEQIDVLEHYVAILRQWLPEHPAEQPLFPKRSRREGHVQPRIRFELPYPVLTGRSFFIEPKGIQFCFTVSVLDFKSENNILNGCCVSFIGKCVV